MKSRFTKLPRDEREVSYSEAFGRTFPGGVAETGILYRGFLTFETTQDNNIGSPRIPTPTCPQAAANHPPLYNTSSVGNTVAAL